MTKQSGFTLAELMIVVSIIGILSAIAIPSYARYVTEAKAADVLVNIHRIALGYVDASYATSQHLSYDSPGFNQAPPALSGLQGLYHTKYGLELASYVVSNSQHVNSLSSESKPIIFIRAPDSGSEAILNALDHVLKQEHAFVASNVMLVALTNDFSPTTNTMASSNSGTSTATPTVTPTAIPSATPSLAPTAIPTPTPTPMAIPSATPTLTGAASGTSNPTSTANPTSGSSQTSSAQPSTVISSQMPAECYRHPGWMKNHLHGC